MTLRPLAQLAQDAPVIVAACVFAAGLLACAALYTWIERRLSRRMHYDGTPTRRTRERHQARALAAVNARGDVRVDPNTRRVA